MPNKIIEIIVEPSKIIVGSTFLLKVKVERVQSYKIITEDNYNIITEDGNNLITEGDYYE